MFQNQIEKINSNQCCCWQTIKIEILRNINDNNNNNDIDLKSNLFPSILLLRENFKSIGVLPKQFSTKISLKNASLIDANIICINKQSQCKLGICQNSTQIEIQFSNIHHQKTKNENNFSKFKLFGTNIIK